MLNYKVAQHCSLYDHRYFQYYWSSGNRLCRFRRNCCLSLGSLHLTSLALCVCLNYIQLMVIAWQMWLILTISRFLGCCWKNRQLHSNQGLRHMKHRLSCCFFSQSFLHHYNCFAKFVATYTAWTRIIFLSGNRSVALGNRMAANILFLRGSQFRTQNI